MKLTKIIATVGPAINSPDLVREMVEAGVDLFRFNLSHGEYEEHLEKIRWIKDLQSSGVNVGIFIDLGGPKFRLGHFKDKVVLRQGDEFILTLEEVEGDEKRAYAPLSDVIRNLKPGDTILLADGTVELEVREVGENEVVTKVRVGGELSSHKGINIPNRMGNISAITEKDVEDLKFGIKAGVNIFALSFVGSKADIINLKRIAKEFGAEIYVISKIERGEAIENLDEIVNFSDAVMVARGDLAVEIPYYKVPILQREIVEKARISCKPAIVATHMLKSILYSPVPTRAEISDIANAVFNGSSALMLSEETAIAPSPVHSVEVMVKIVEEAERYLKKSQTEMHFPKASGDLEMKIAQSAVELGYAVDAKVIVTPTASGATPLRVSALRPRIPIVAPTKDRKVFEFLNLAYGVYPLLVKDMKSLEEIMDEVKLKVLERGFAQRGDLVVITAGYPFGSPGSTNMVKVEKL